MATTQIESRRTTRGSVTPITIILAASLTFGQLSPAAAQDAEPVSTEEIERLRQQILQQNQRLQQQQQILSQQQQALQEQLRRLRQLEAAAKGEEPPEEEPAAEEQQRRATAQAQPQEGAAGVSEEPEAPERAPEVSIFADVGGVLTPGGSFVLEANAEYTHASINRFFFQGVEIVEAVLVGLIEATDADRDSYTFSLGARYGITDRLEIDAKVPYLFRDDRITAEAVADEALRIRELDGDGLGDVEFGLHYQINRGRGGWPFFVANVRGKSRTGEGPFEITRDADGVETELPRGSGFWAVEPSLTIIYPTDPAVLFANVGYLFNFARNVDVALSEDIFIGRVDPGDTIRGSFGIGFALNEKLSMNLGYEHSVVRGTKTVTNGFESKSTSLQVGSLLFGLSLGVSNTVGLNLNLSAGITDDAPDARIGLRIPVSF